MIGHLDLFAAVAHSVEYLGLLGGVGSFVVRRLGRIKPRLVWAQPPMHYAFAAALAGGLLLLIEHPSPAGAARVAAEFGALYLCLTGNRYVAPFAVLAAGLLPLTSHAATLPDPAGAEFADALHVLSAGMWAGGILALASLRPPGGWAGEEARVLLERFGRVAVIAFGVTALTGLLRATEQVAGLADLWTTPYGIVLVLKSAAVLTMLGLSLAWRRGLPASRVEALMAAAAVLATGFLAVLPSPA